MPPKLFLCSICLHTGGSSVYKRAFEKQPTIEGKGKKMKLLATAAALVALLVCVSALADTIELKNGDKIDGKILEETDKAVRIKTPYGILRIPREKIAKVVKDAPKPVEKPPQKEGGLVVVELTNGDKIEGKIVEETKETITIKTAYGPLTIARSRIVRVAPKGAKPVKEGPKEEESKTVVVELKNGDRIEGEIIEETEKAIKLKSSFGPMTIPRSEIASVKKVARPGKELLAKKKELAGKHYELAMWAKDKGLAAEAKLNLEAAIAVYPDHEKARAALGYVKKDGEWVKGEKPKPVEPKKEMSSEELLKAHEQAQQHLQSKEYDKALEIYGKILKSYPDDLTANYNTACLLSLGKKTEESLKFLEHAVRKARELLKSGTWEEQQGAKAILDLLGTDTDLDNLRETDKFKEILKIAKGEKVEPKTEPEKKPEKSGGAYLTVLLATLPRTPEAEKRIKAMLEFMRAQVPDLNIRMDKENIHIEVGRFKLSERAAAEKKLKEIEELAEAYGGVLPFSAKIIKVEPEKKEDEKPEKKEKERDF